ncbi:dihydroxyacetone kinase subunit DhaK [Isoptericola dokdonensis]|uniref:PTS-dependent dihydroxyacetone kinase, dihydroxyacetone-binding subunit DhaK n=1 Tax=Isoptericola dokdonensis DS-3 TaxID=1300344 RepID=A0A168EYV2_9MICO|nr:dihydroxyacetone kinase subunit DhaK [Isoptericola dokdonensis]ANC30662.1 PTS-dependent dihydroxyacetone kinase, dihydroxyacetone-binding subunit DhaK [Isoptericola dokdonensis DS-3]
MKKLLDDPAEAVTDALQGLAAAHPDLLTVHHEPTYVQRAGGTPPGHVGVVSGGGSGHEPLHTGFVGSGMLDAAVPGAVFTSPTADQVAAALKAADGGAGVLAIVKNYTGDVLNFETAVELAQLDGVEVASVLVNDDVAVEDSMYTAGRRGVAGTLFVEKVAGAAAARGDSLEAVAGLARRAVGRVRTMGVALSACTVPHVGRPSFDLPDDEVEIGIGIHGEPGRHRIPAGGARDIATRLVDAVLDDLAPAGGEQVLLFVNGMGGTPLSELYGTYARAREVVEARGVRVVRSLVGSYVTSLEMQGASVTVAVLDDELTALWDAPVRTPALTW